MISKRMSVLALAAWTVVLLTWALAPVRAVEPGQPIKIGMVQSFFLDVSKPIIDWLPTPFAQLMKDHTGLEGKLVIGGDYHHVAKMLVEKKVDLGVFHGFEFAWAQSKFPELRPVMIAIYKHHGLRANLVVRDDCPAKSLQELKGKDLALPLNSKGHCRLFLDRSCETCGGGSPKAFFHDVTRSANVRAALDDVVSGTVHAAIVDGEFLESYADLKPGCYARLKVLIKSELFPSGVLACRQGTLDEATLARFRDGMTQAHKFIVGRDLMLMFKIGAFEPPPSNYGQMLTDILRVYPAPEATAVPVDAKN